MNESFFSQATGKLRKLHALALFLGLASIVGALGIGYVAYLLSMGSTERRYRSFYLREATLLAKPAEASSRLSDEALLKAIESAWKDLRPKPPDEYVCVVDRQCRCILHTAFPQTLGRDCGGNRIPAEGSHPSRTIQEMVDAQRSYVGSYVSSAGQEQIAAFVPIARDGWMLGLHRSKEALKEEIDQSIRFLRTGFYMVCGILMPFSLVLLWKVFNRVEDSRRKTKEALGKSESRYRTLVDNLQDGLFIACNGKVAFVNGAFARMAGYENDEIVGMELRDFMAPVPENEACAQVCSKEGSEKGSEELQFRLRRQGGEPGPLVKLKSAEVDHEGCAAVAGIITDITPFKLAEDEIRRALEEKEVLLGEIHHRVKNNMQVICSLLELQGEYSGNALLREMLHDSQTRIRSMALVYEKLHQSSSLAKIPLKSYIENLVAALCRFQPGQANGISIDKEKIEDIHLGIDDAVPCGLVLNELIANCFKHAFPDGRTGEIRIEAHALDDAVLEMKVKDNGVGIPESLDPRSSSSLGLELVTGLVEHQLGGEWELRRGGGTEFVLRFRKRSSDSKTEAVRQRESKERPKP